MKVKLCHSAQNSPVTSHATQSTPKWRVPRMTAKPHQIWPQRLSTLSSFHSPCSCCLLNLLSPVQHPCLCPGRFLSRFHSPGLCTNDPLWASPPNYPSRIAHPSEPSIPWLNFHSTLHHLTYYMHVHFAYCLSAWIGPHHPEGWLGLCFVHTWHLTWGEHSVNTCWMDECPCPSFHNSGALLHWVASASSLRTEWECIIFLHSPSWTTF